MGKRSVSERSPDAVLESGGIDKLLERHAADRIYHFFMFCFYVEITCDYLSTVHGRAATPIGSITDHATHQVDTGMRNPNIKKIKLDSPNPETLQATGWGSMDAAHTNNLGLKDGFTAMCEQIGQYDFMVAKLYSRCVELCSNTRLLPQAINLGPDKVIDQVHRNLRFSAFGPASTEPCVAIANIRAYADQAKTMLAVMAGRKSDRNTLVETKTYYIKGIADIEYKLAVDIGNEIELVVFDVNSHLQTMSADRNSPAAAQRLSWSAMPHAANWFANANLPSTGQTIVRKQRTGGGSPASQDSAVFKTRDYVQTPSIPQTPRLSPLRFRARGTNGQGNNSAVSVVAQAHPSATSADMTD